MPQLTEPANLPSGSFNATPKFNDTTVRQTIKLDLPSNYGNSSKRIRLRISNAFGTTPLTITSASIARPAGNVAGSSVIIPETLQNITFDAGTSAGITIAPAALGVSDDLSFDFSGISTYVGNGTKQAGSLVTVTLYLADGQAGEAITSHPGSRTDIYLAHGDQVGAQNITGSDLQSAAHWYFISAMEALEEPAASSFILVGDSITDGRGSITDANNRWPDFLYTRMQASNDSLVRKIAVDNQAAGGNRVLADGLGPSAVSRIDRDVLAQSAVKYALLFEGVNDIGDVAAEEAAQAQIYDDLIAGYRQIITRVHAQNIPIFGATITPFGGLSTIQPYSDPAGIREQTRSKVNAWIRDSGEFDAVVDFDAIVRNPANVTQLNPLYDSGDFLHPNPAGYAAMAQGFPLEVFRQFAK